MKKQAFTLVELIVVVTILAILATIGFVSYSGYLTGVRDTNRVASLTSISDGLELYRTKNDLPDPDDYIKVQNEGIDIAKQGYIGSNILQTIEYSKAGRDPKDDSYYSYYLTDDKKHYQLMAFLEESENLESVDLGFKSYASINYSIRHPKVYGKRLGIMTDVDNTPIQEISTISSAGILNVSSTGTLNPYKAYFSDSDITTGTGKNIIAGVLSKQVKALYASCKEILDKNSTLQGADEYYYISSGGNKKNRVYCDMTTDGGGWTPIFNIGENSQFGGYEQNLVTNFQGGNCDTWNGSCISSNYNSLLIGDDVMIEGSESDIKQDNSLTKVIINNISSGKGKTIYEILNDANSGENCKYPLGSVDIVIKKDNNITSSVDLYGLTNVAGSTWCLNDRQSVSGTYSGFKFVLGGSGGNSAGWPNRVYNNHTHKNYRLWTR